MNEPVTILEVVEIATGKVVHTLPVRGDADKVNRVITGLLINRDMEQRFFVRETEAAS